VSKTKSQLEKWFPDKKYWQFIVTKRACPLGWTDRLVYSTLVYSLRMDNAGLALCELAKRCQLHRNKIIKPLLRLQKLGLVTKLENWQACGPNPDQWKWFASHNKTVDHWTKGFCTYQLLKPTPECLLNDRANGLLWSLWSLWLSGPQRIDAQNNPLLYDQTIKGLATLNSISLNCCKTAIVSLTSNNLLHYSNNTFKLLPNSQQLNWWDGTNTTKQQTNNKFVVGDVYKTLDARNTKDWQEFADTMANNGIKTHDGL
jgi:hypothetical protein